MSDRLHSADEGELASVRAENITCPWCGSEDLDSWERGDDWEDNTTCDECGKPYTWQRNIEISYTTERKGDNQ